jgi:uncharacterized protein
MQTKIQLQVSPKTAVNEQLLKEEAISNLGLSPREEVHIKLLKRSIDARNRNIKINVTLQVSINEPLPEEHISFSYPNVSAAANTCHIIGAGPAGLFAALRCIENKIKPIIYERGKDVKARRRDLAAINREHIVNPESNYCFGEGGAGTYSDGKLYTRSNKRGDIEKVLKVLVFHGASHEILVDAHPHIGTNKLPQLIENIRETILKQGGEIHFNTRLTNLKTAAQKISTVTIQHQDGSDEVPVQKLILATGHSARDIFELLY